jgi:hypothetical protein
MARFKEVTGIGGGGKIVINVDNICTMQRKDPKATIIHFVGDRFIHVVEVPAEIIADPIDPRL